jgi:hypothetical protein
VQCCLPSIVDCPLPICVVVRFACAQGKHRAFTMGSIFEDWLQRSFCPVWHIALGKEDDYFDVAKALQDGLNWLEDTTIGQPGLQTKTTTVDSHETCNADSFDNQTVRYPAPIKPANSVWLGTAATAPAALHLDAVLCMHERRLHSIQHQVTLHIYWKIY